MKCLSIRQPWATLIVRGFTSCDVRSWRTAHRGPLAIHAASKLPDDVTELCRRPPMRLRLQSAGYQSVFDLPRGRVLGVVELVDCQVVRAEAGVDLPGEWSRLEGRSGGYIWRLAQPWALAEPLVMSGKRGIFDIADLFPQVVHDLATVGGEILAACPVAQTG